MKDEVVARLDQLEQWFLDAVQEIRSIRFELQNGSRSDSLERLLTPEEVSQILGEPLSHVYAMARSKRIPSLKIGKYLKFSPTSLRKCS